MERKIEFWIAKSGLRLVKTNKTFINPPEYLSIIMYLFFQILSLENSESTLS